MATTERNFYRCPDCLSVVAVDSPAIVRPVGKVRWGFVSPAPDVACAWCSITLEHMGRVEATRLVTDTQRDLCDDRCMGAQGPKCSCSCNGANHGGGILVVIGTSDAGGLPTVTPTGDRWKGRKQAEAGAEWRRLKADTLTAIHAAYPELAAKGRGEWITAWPRYMEGAYLRADWRRVCAMRSPARVKTMLALTAPFLMGSNHDNQS